MANIKYDTADIFPLVIMVLTYTSTDLAMSVFKVALENQYQDLKGMVDPEHLDQEMIDLVWQLDDPLSLTVKEAKLEIGEYINHICMLKGIDHVELCEDEHITELASDFYADASLYCPSNNRSKGPLGDLYCFTFCIDHIIYRLCTTMITEKNTSTRMIYKRWRSLKKVNFSDFNACDRYELRLLVQLGVKLDQICDRIVDLAGKRRHKRPGHVSKISPLKKQSQ